MQLNQTLKTFFYENEHEYTMGQNSTFIGTYKVKKFQMYFHIKTDIFGLNLQNSHIFWYSFFTPWASFRRKFWKALSQGIYKVYKW